MAKRAAAICMRINQNYLYHNYHQYFFAQPIKYISYFFLFRPKIQYNSSEAVCLWNILNIIKMIYIQVNI